MAESKDLPSYGIDLDRWIDYPAYYRQRIIKCRCNGDQLTGLCPFHDDHAESFGVNLKTGQWLCRAGCGNGNVISFHAKTSKISTREAYRELLMMYQIDSSPNGRSVATATSVFPKTAEGKAIPPSVLTLFENIPDAVLQYMRERRGWSDEIIGRYRIGYNSKQIFEPGNVGAERITIPIFDPAGNLVNIRCYLPEAKEYKIVSYSTGSRKSSNKVSFGEGRLYPMHMLGRARELKRIIYVTEGEPDCLCGLSQGMLCITSTTGSQSWQGQWDPLFRDLHVRVVYDNDEAGRAGSEKVATHLSQFAGKVEVVSWPGFMREKEDLTDWFVKYRKTLADLESLDWKQLEMLKKISRQELADRIEASDDFDELTGPIAKDVALSGLPESHILSLQKLIAKKSGTITGGHGVSVAALKADVKGFRNVQADMEFMHLEAAREVQKAFGINDVLATSSAPWVYGAGVWRQLEDREIKQKIHAVAESEQLTKNVVDSILDLFKTEIFRPGHKFDIDRQCINVRNGELHFENGIWQLRKHCREHYRTTQIPVSYDPNAQAPRFLKFLSEIFRDDPDRNEKSWIVSEGFGYSLLSSCKFEKFFLLIGAGANGKSVLMDTLAALVGSDHVCAVQPSQFENRFQRAHLFGKLVNLVTEIAEGHEIADAQLKAIVSGELTTAEHKHQKPFDFQPFATCWFGTNHMPHTRDFSDALFRRAIILTFNRVFQESEQDKNLKEKLREELPGILNFALQGLCRLFTNREFTRAGSVETAKHEWRMDCDQVAQFAEECCTLGPSHLVTSSRVYSRYEEWGKEAGIRKMLNRKNFTVRLSRLGVELYKGTGGTRMLAGINLKE